MTNVFQQVVSTVGNAVQAASNAASSLAARLGITNNQGAYQNTVAGIPYNWTPGVAATPTVGPGTVPVAPSVMTSFFGGGGGGGAASFLSGAAPATSTILGGTAPATSTILGGTAPIQAVQSQAGNQAAVQQYLASQGLNVSASTASTIGALSRFDTGTTQNYIPQNSNYNAPTGNNNSLSFLDKISDTSGIYSPQLNAFVQPSNIKQTAIIKAPSPSQQTAIQEADYKGELFSTNPVQLQKTFNKLTSNVSNLSQSDLQDVINQVQSMGGQVETTPNVLTGNIDYRFIPPSVGVGFGMNKIPVPLSSIDTGSNVGAIKSGLIQYAVRGGLGLTDKGLIQGTTKPSTLYTSYSGTTQFQNPVKAINLPGSNYALGTANQVSNAINLGTYFIPGEFLTEAGLKIAELNPINYVKTYPLEAVGLATMGVLKTANTLFPSEQQVFERALQQSQIDLGNQEIASAKNLNERLGFLNQLKYAEGGGTKGIIEYKPFEYLGEGTKVLSSTESKALYDSLGNILKVSKNIPPSIEDIGKYSQRLLVNPVSKEVQLKTGSLLDIEKNIKLPEFKAYPFKPIEQERFVLSSTEKSGGITKGFGLGYRLGAEGTPVDRELITSLSGKKGPTLFKVYSGYVTNKNILIGNENILIPTIKLTREEIAETKLLQSGQEGNVAARIYSTKYNEIFNPNIPNRVSVPSLVSDYSEANLNRFKYPSYKTSLTGDIIISEKPYTKFSGELDNLGFAKVAKENKFVQLAKEYPQGTIYVSDTDRITNIIKGEKSSPQYLKQLYQDNQILSLPNPTTKISIPKIKTIIPQSTLEPTYPIPSYLGGGVSTNPQVSTATLSPSFISPTLTGEMTIENQNQQIAPSQVNTFVNLNNPNQNQPTITRAGTLTNLNTNQAQLQPSNLLNPSAQETSTSQDQASATKTTQTLAPKTMTRESQIQPEVSATAQQESFISKDSLLNPLNPEVTKKVSNNPNPTTLLNLNSLISKQKIIVKKAISKYKAYTKRFGKEVYLGESQSVQGAEKLGIENTLSTLSRSVIVKNEQNQQVPLFNPNTSLFRPSKSKKNPFTLIEINPLGAKSEVREIKSYQKPSNRLGIIAPKKNAIKIGSNFKASKNIRGGIITRMKL